MLGSAENLWVRKEYARNELYNKQGLGFEREVYYVIADNLHLI